MSLPKGDLQETPRQQGTREVVPARRRQGHIIRMEEEGSKVHQQQVQFSYSLSMFHRHRPRTKATPKDKKGRKERDQASTTTKNSVRPQPCTNMVPSVVEIELVRITFITRGALVHTIFQLPARSTSHGIGSTTTLSSSGLGLLLIVGNGPYTGRD